MLSSIGLLSAAIALTFFAFDTTLDDTVREYYFVNNKISFLRIASAVVLAISVVYFLYAFYRGTVSAASSNAEIIADIAARRDKEKTPREITPEEKKRREDAYKEFKAREEERRERSRAIERTRNLRDINNNIAADWKEYLLAARIRLLENQERLSQRSRLNLVWGVMLSVFTIVAVIVIIWLNFDRAPAESWVELVSLNLSKITLVVVLQLLAFFFLNNFIKTERSFERNKAEVTDIEKKMSAVLLLSECGDSHMYMANRFAIGNETSSDNDTSVSKEDDELMHQLLKLVTKHSKP